MKQLNLTPDLYEYILDVSSKEHPVLSDLRQATASLPLANMQISPVQAQLMQMLIRLMRANRILELGTFTGYSALAMALALPEDGELITCDINQEWTSKAHVYWEKANVSNKIKLRLAPALETLNELLNNGFDKSFDFIFVDADKSNYLNYYELALKLIQSNGLIMIDNALWGGKVAININEMDRQTKSIHQLNEHIKHDNRVYASLLPISDGLFLISPVVN